MSSGYKAPEQRLDWEQQCKQAKNLWIFAVFGFYVSVIVAGIVWFLHREVNLILVSVILGMMVLGVWLKTRYQLLVRKGAPDNDDTTPPREQD
jgi:hypothetical protein